jgi:glutamate N-acetyltransferase / amino-acid N-acetyltransferase
MKLIQGSITRPEGFKAAGVNCGIRRKKLDLGLLYSQTPAIAAGVFTKNRLYAPHIDIDKEHIKKGKVQAILVNSGNANCYNGKKGLGDAKSLIKEMSRVLGLPEESVLINSTGLIGRPLPVKSMKKKMGQLVHGLKKDKKEFAQAILTTDRKEKQAAASFKIGKREIIISACIKGAGMIHPNMATTLCFITTDAKIEKKALKKALRSAVDKTLNLISVEGETSPNDSCIILANGLAQNKTIEAGSKAYLKFLKALILVLDKLSKMLVEGAEGATKTIKIKVKGASNYSQAKKLAFSIANSNLLKATCYGENPNWGRVVSRVGSSEVNFKPEKLEVALGGITVFKNLEPQKYDRKKLVNAFRKKKIDVTVNLYAGKEEISVLTCDLTPEYIEINARYRV